MTSPHSLAISVDDRTFHALATRARASHSSVEEQAKHELAAVLQDIRPPVALTGKQGELYRFISGYIAEKGLSPTFNEMCTAVGRVSKSSISSLLSGLEERGAIRRLPYRARAIEIVGRRG